MIEAPGISVIILAYNEEDNLGPMLDESILWLKGNINKWEIIVVDDGSTDATRRVAESFSENESRVQICVHNSNRGMGAGMRTGISAATLEYFTIIAGDGQHPTSELARMIPALDDADIVTTFHENQRELPRRVLSWGFRKAMKWACGIEFVLEGIYLFPRQVAVDDISLDRIPNNTFFFSFELIARALQRGHSIAVRPMTVRPRQFGQSKVAGIHRIRRISSEILGFRARLRAERQ